MTFMQPDASARASLRLGTFDLAAFLAPLPPKAAYDYLKAAAALQGIANRERPQLYFFYESNAMAREQGVDMDRYWLRKLSMPDEAWAGYTIEAWDEGGFVGLLHRFSSYYYGLVLWDEAVPATANVASTIAGADSLLPVRYDPQPGSLYDLLVNRLQIAVSVSLHGKFTGSGIIPGTGLPSTGSAKNDAYLWAKTHYLDTGRTNSTLMAYFLDAAPWHNNGGDLDARLCFWTLPKQMEAGSSAEVSLLFKNSGTLSWPVEEGLRLESVRIGAGATNSFIWHTNESGNAGEAGNMGSKQSDVGSLGRVRFTSLQQAVPEETGCIKPGEQIGFCFTLIAPSSPGTYMFCARLALDGVTFGDFAIRSIVVREGIGISAAGPQAEEVGEWYYPDVGGCYLANADYYIAGKAFFFDLSPDGESLPNDDRGQPLGTDRRTLDDILASQQKQAHGQLITLGGFVPWLQKYTTTVNSRFRLNPVEAEWLMIDLASRHYAQSDADAGAISVFSNASAFRHVPLRLPAQVHQRSPAQLSGALANHVGNHAPKYIVFFMGDFDSGAWTSNVLPLLWDDPRRGELPLAWSFAPGLGARIPHLFNYLYATKGSNDYFVAADNGTGYLNPMMLADGCYNTAGCDIDADSVSDKLAAWEAHNRAVYAQFGLDITGFLISGRSESLTPAVQRAYSRISAAGVGTNGGYPDAIVAGTPFTPVITASMEDVDPIALGERLAGVLGGEGQFFMLRIVLTRPSVLADALHYLHRHYPELQATAVDPYTFFKLYKEQLTAGGLIR